MSTACFFCRQYNEESVRVIGEMGITEAEIFFSARGEYAADYIKEVKRIANGEGVNIRSVHALCTQFEPQLFSAHERQKNEAHDVYMEVLDAASALGAELYVFHGPMNVKRAKTLQIDYAWAGETVSALADEAKAAGIKLAYETVHWCWYNAPGFAKELSRHAQSDNLYFTMDIKQVAQSGFSLDEYISDMGSRLAHVHICDYKKDPEKGIVPCLPFEGEVDWQRLKQRLKDIGFDGYLMEEVYPSNYQTNEQLMENYCKLQTFFQK